LVFYLDAPLGVLISPFFALPAAQSRSTPHNEVDEDENIYGQRSDNKQILPPPPTASPGGRQR
jgi:hypothetical protein